MEAMVNSILSRISFLGINLSLIIKISKLCHPILVESLLFDFDQHNSHESMVTIKPNGLKTPRSTKSRFSHLHIKKVLETVTYVHHTFKVFFIYFIYSYIFESSLSKYFASMFLLDTKMRCASLSPKANCCCCRSLTWLWPWHLLWRANAFSCYSSDFT